MKAKNEIIYVLGQLKMAGYLTSLEFDYLAYQIGNNEELPHTSVEGRSIYLIDKMLYAYSCYILSLDEELEALITIDNGNEYCVRLNGEIILSGNL